jgi:hypothetical protein
MLIKSNKPYHIATPYLCLKDHLALVIMKSCLQTWKSLIKYVHNSLIYNSTVYAICSLIIVLDHEVVIAVFFLVQATRIWEGPTIHCLEPWLGRQMG